MSWVRAKPQKADASAVRPKEGNSTAQRSIVRRGPQRARIVLELTIKVFGFHVHRARPVFRCIGRVDEFVEQLFGPGIEFHFSDGTVEILNFDGLVVVVDRDHFKELVGTASIPLTYDRPDCVHRRLPSPSAMLDSIQLRMSDSRNMYILRAATSPVIEQLVKFF